MYAYRNWQTMASHHSEVHLIDLGGVHSNKLLPLLEDDYPVVVSLLERHNVSKPLLTRCDVKALSQQVCPDGQSEVFTSKEGCGLHKHEAHNDLSIKVNQIKQAIKCLKDDRQQKRKLLILVSSDNHGQFTVEHQFLEAIDAAWLASICKQPSMPDGKAVCFIIVGTYQVSMFL